MDKTEYVSILKSLLEQMLKRLDECEPESVIGYVATIINLADTIYALDRKLNV
ncbi:hypothetical protein D3C79_1118660 [compost metagenome]